MIINVVDIVDDLLLDRAKNNNRDNSHFHPSSWDGCKRLHAYAYYESQGFITVDQSALKISPQLERIFGNGHGMHDRWRDYLESTGALMGVWECANWIKHTNPKFYGTNSKLGCLKPDKCDCGESKFYYHEVGFLDPETMWGGHVDAIIDHKIFSQKRNGHIVLPDEELFIIDFKSINSFDFKSLDRPKPEHITQMQIYLYLSGLKYGKFVYEDKNNQSVKEFLVVADPAILTIKKAEAIALKNVVTMSINGKHYLPKRGFSTRAHPSCQRCKYRSHCWDDIHEEKKAAKKIGDLDV